MIYSFYNNNGGGGSYTLPVASPDTLGGVKVGENLSIDENGVLSVEGGSGDTEEIEQVTAAAINDLRYKVFENIVNKHYSKEEINEKLAAFVSAAELDKYALVTFVSELITEIYSRIESSELAAAAALNDLNNR